MKKSAFIIFAAAAIAAAASCQQKGVELIPQDTNKVSFKISLPDEDTKLDWDRSTGRVHWSAGDKIFLADTDAKTDLITIGDNWNGMRNAVIESDKLGQNANGYYAIYPGNENMSFAASFYGVSHEIVPDGSFGSSLAYVAEANGEKNFIGAYYTGLMVFEINDPDIKSVTFEGLTPNDVFITGVNYLFGSRDNTGRILTEATKAVTSITVSTEAGPGIYFIGSYPTSLSGVKITASTGTQNTEVVLEQPFTINPGRIHDFGELTGRFGHLHKTASTDFSDLGTIESSLDKYYFANGDLIVNFQKGNSSLLPHRDRSSGELILHSNERVAGNFINIYSDSGYKIAAVRIYFGSLSAHTYFYRIWEESTMQGPYTASAGAVRTWYNLDTQQFSLFAAPNGTSDSPGISISRIDVTYRADTRQDAPIVFMDVTGAPVGQNVLQAVLGETFTQPTLDGALGRNVTYSSFDESVATVDPATGAVTPVGAGQTTIHAYAEGNYYYKAAAATYKINVTEPGVIVGIKNLRDALLSYTEATEFVAKVTDAVITGNNQTSFYLEGDNAGVYVYTRSDLGFSVGTTLTGTITGKGFNYSNGIPEITEFSFEGTTGGVTAIVPVTLTIAELNANYSDYVCRRIKIENVTVTDAFGGSDRDGIVTLRRDNLTIRTASGTYVKESYPETAVLDICGYPVYYNGEEQFAVNKDADVTVRSMPVQTATITGFPSTYTIVVGQQWNPGATTNSTAPVIYTSDNDAVAGVNVKVNLVEGYAAGTCIITANVAATEGYTAASAVCTLTVKSQQDLYYERVYSAPTTWAGKYIIVTEYQDNDGNNVCYALSGQAVTDKGPQNYGAYADVSAAKLTTHAAIQATADIREYEVEIVGTANGYSIKQGDSYLGLNANSNALYFSTSFKAERDEWSISMEPGANGAVKLINVKYPKSGDDDRFLQYNANSSGLRFACYKPGQKPVFLYKLN